MNVSLDIKSRESVSPLIVYLTPVFTVVAALAVSSIALIVLNINPIDAYYQMFWDTLTSEFGQDETIVKAVPLILTGLAVYLPLKAGLWNIGAEGQLVVGAIAGSWVAVNVSQSTYVLLPLMFVAAGVAGAFWAGVPAYLRARWDVNEIITTLLLTFVALNINEYLVRGPMQGGTGNFPNTERFSAAATLPNLPLRDIHAGIVLALVLGILTYVLVTRTRIGFEITFVGSNHEAATQAGMSKRTVYLLVFVLGGAFAGFAGISEVSGVQGVLRASFNPGYGFTAIVIALLGRNSAIKVVGAGLFFALVFVGGSSMEVAYGVPASLVDVIQALIILFLITAEFFKRYRVGIDIEREEPGTQPRAAGGDA